METNNSKSISAGKLRAVLLQLAAEIKDNASATVSTGENKYMFICGDTAIVIGKISRQ